MAAGAPTKYTEEMPKLFLESMKRGEFVVQFCASVNIHKDTLYEWVKVHPEFSDAFRLGKMYAEAHWGKYAVSHFENSKFNTNLFKFVMSNTIGWNEKKETENNVNLRDESDRRVRRAEEDYKA